ncbi:hydrogenase maturation protease [Streptomyces sp. GMY02]|uniref:hydrogenase maturation protease n=1 Tax=Streptomyces sp. GMY02 TaxID=1333528 RepID=UPI001C2C62E1|nr:hydrogenase maturation protease [Streptomyces sp. GMY02]
MAGRTLVAGIGNVFLGDDGFGVETLRVLAGHRLPPDVELMDTGIRGVHLAYRLLDGYRGLVLLDTVDRGAPAGTLHVLDIDPVDPAARGTPQAAVPLDGHGMDPAAVLRLVHELHAGAGGTLPERIVLVGCQPLTLEEGIGLSEPVAAAVGPAAGLVLDLIRHEGHKSHEGHGDHVAHAAHAGHQHEGRQGGDDRDARDARDTGGTNGGPPQKPPQAPPRQPPQDPHRAGGPAVAVGLRRSGHGRGGVRDGEVGTGPAPLSPDAADVDAREAEARDR